MTLPIKIIDAHELHKKCGQEAQLCLIDVREIDEWNSGYIPGAAHIPKDQLLSRINEITTDSDMPIYLYCKGGVRSAFAAQQLMQMGYQSVYSLEGGIMNWCEKGYSLQK
jgi:rhodanese-related sulfurtransferase